MQEICAGLAVLLTLVMHEDLCLRRSKDRQSIIFAQVQGGRCCQVLAVGMHCLDHDHALV